MAGPEVVSRSNRSSSPSAVTAEEKSPLRERVGPGTGRGGGPATTAAGSPRFGPRRRRADSRTALSGPCLLGLPRPAPGAGVQRARKAAKLEKRSQAFRVHHMRGQLAPYHQSPPPGPDWARSGLRVLIGGARCSSLPPRAASLDPSLAR